MASARAPWRSLIGGASSGEVAGLRALPVGKLDDHLPAATRTLDGFGGLRANEKPAAEPSDGKKAQRKAIWWSIEQGQPIPSGLKLEYDGQPLGHCTLTATRDMTVKTFLSLVSLITFVPRGTDLYGLI